MKVEQGVWTMTSGSGILAERQWWWSVHIGEECPLPSAGISI